ncbi:hypothetical protein [Micromonospora inyonensis]|uniref:Uncharacterized protein n=1 Tax=Micromonospora inyonensis TaxID=47866 RepID=A0A1C6R9D6_9ACTN|nr:hypothetical protein [Micromonospora inyonensis]SCL13567.1 hypothetical protein GA0074694_0392 [Micromonospora inyonensis]
MYTTEEMFSARASGLVEIPAPVTARLAPGASSASNSHQAVSWLLSTAYQQFSYFVVRSRSLRTRT